MCRSLISSLRSKIPAAARMRAAARAKVDAAGLVQGVAGAPDFRHAGIAPEGQAFFLLMETAAGKGPGSASGDSDHGL